MSLSPLVPRGLHGCLVVRLLRSRSTSHSHLMISSWIPTFHYHYSLLSKGRSSSYPPFVPAHHEQGTLPNLIWCCTSGPYHRPPSRPCWGPWTRGRSRWSTRSYSPASPPRTRTSPTPRSSRRIVSRLIIRIAAWLQHQHQGDWIQSQQEGAWRIVTPGSNKKQSTSQPTRLSEVCL